MNPIDFGFGFAIGALVALIVAARMRANVTRTAIRMHQEMSNLWDELQQAKEAAMAKEATSKRVAAIAARILKQKDLFGPDILALAASCLTQREPKVKKLAVKK